MPASISDYIPQCGPSSTGALRKSRVAWGVVVVVALVLLALVTIAPLMLAHGYFAVSHVIYSAFRAVCHQMPGRSLHVENHPLAVCARCFGLYAGFAVGASVYPLLRAIKLRHTPARVWLLIGVLPTATDFALGIIGVWENTHLSRSLTGALFGVVAAFYVVPGVVDLTYTNWRNALRPRSFSGERLSSTATGDF